MTTDDSKLQKQDLLLKMLNMTTSDNDNQALVAMRKANDLLRSAGWTWEKLLAGKITIVEDPFKSTSAFDSIHKNAKKAEPTPEPDDDEEDFAPPRRGNPPSQRPQNSGMGFGASPVSNAAAAQRNRTVPTPRSTGLTALSTKGNVYANSCYCCGDHVDARAGWIFRPSDFNSTAPNKWEVVCDPCNKKIDTPIARSKAMKTGKAAGAPSHVNLNQL